MGFVLPDYAGLHPGYGEVVLLKFFNYSVYSLVGTFRRQGRQRE